MLYSHVKWFVVVDRVIMTCDVCEHKNNCLNYSRFIEDIGLFYTLTGCFSPLDDKPTKPESAWITVAPPDFSGYDYTISAFYECIGDEPI